jgi:hypothetical protein
VCFFCGGAGALFAWGRAEYGKLGLGSIDNTDVISPKRVRGSRLVGQSGKDTQLSLEGNRPFSRSRSHSLDLFQSLVTGLSHSSRHRTLSFSVSIALFLFLVRSSQVLGSLEGVKVVSVACGDKHSCAVDR